MSIDEAKLHRLLETQLKEIGDKIVSEACKELHHAAKDRKTTEPIRIEVAEARESNLRNNGQHVERIRSMPVSMPDDDIVGSGLRSPRGDLRSPRMRSPGDDLRSPREHAGNEVPRLGGGDRFQTTSVAKLTKTELQIRQQKLARQRPMPWVAVSAPLAKTGPEAEGALVATPSSPSKSEKQVPDAVEKAIKATNAKRRISGTGIGSNGVNNLDLQMLQNFHSQDSKNNSEENDSDDGEIGETIQGLRKRLSSVRRSRSYADNFDLGVAAPEQMSWQVFFWDVIILDYFDYVMGLFLVANAIWIGVQVDQNTRLEVDDEFRSWSTAIDLTFCCVFVGELLFRVRLQGAAFFKYAEGWKWNAFDVVVVGFQLSEQIYMLAHPNETDSGVFERIGIIRTLRLGRLARLVRLVRLIPELKSMVYLILASMGSFFWTVTLMSLMLYVFAIYFTEMATDLTRNNRELSKDQSSDLERYWGSLMQSMLSLYMAITGGDDWRNFIEAFSDPASKLSNIMVFTAYIAFATLVMLNLVTGVFVEGAQRIIKEEQDQDVMRMACKIFVDADADMSNSITWDEFVAMADSPAMLLYCDAVGITYEEAYGLFSILDKDKSNSLNISEFVKGCLRLRSTARSIDIAQLHQDFDHSVSVLDKRTLATHKMLKNICQQLHVDPARVQSSKDEMDDATDDDDISGISV